MIRDNAKALDGKLKALIDKLEADTGVSSDLEAEVTKYPTHELHRQRAMLIPKSVAPNEELLPTADAFSHNSVAPKFSINVDLKSPHFAPIADFSSIKRSAGEAGMNSLDFETSLKRQWKD